MTGGIVVSLAVLLAGCSGNVNVQGSAGGGTVSSGSNVNIQGRSGFGNLLAIGVLVGMSYGSERAMEEAGPPFAARPGYVTLPSTRAPDLDPRRRVVEQDCTRPIEDWSANLKCR